MANKYQSYAIYVFNFFNYGWHLQKITCIIVSQMTYIATPCTQCNRANPPNPPDQKPQRSTEQAMTLLKSVL